MNKRKANKIIKNVAKRKTIFYTKKQVQLAFFKCIRALSAKSRMNAIGCVMSASCNDTIPFTDWEIYGWDKPFLPWGIAKSIGKYF